MKRFLYNVYQFLMVLFLPFFSLFLLARVISRPSYRSGITQRLGLYPDGFFKPLQGKMVFWVHAVSVGEVISSELFIQSLRERCPNAAIVFSTVTPSGQRAACQRLKGIDLFIYFPIDLVWITRSVVRKISPALFIFLETEIWPNFLLSLEEKKVPSILLNGRVSDEAFRRYCWIRFFLTHVLQGVSLFLMQTERDVEKLLCLGAPPDRVEQTGNMKYDQAVSERARKEGVILRTELGLGEGERVMIAGSTHEGEEEAILETYQMLVSKLGRLVLLIAPRHLERLDYVEQLVSKRGYAPMRKTALADVVKSNPHPKFEIILLNTLGELDQFYSMADLIFVGGSLVPVGGHNVLEAAACRKPVFFGPYMANFKEISDQLKGSGGGIEVKDGKELAWKMVWLLEHPEEFKKRGESAYQVVLNNRGAVGRNCERVAQWVERLG
jgi:3-deoxy-D-manno-octulosonic-acid transferase